MHVALVKMNFGNKLTPIEIKFGKVRDVFSEIASEFSLVWEKSM